MDMGHHTSEDRYGEESHTISESASTRHSKGFLGFYGERHSRGFLGFSRSMILFGKRICKKVGTVMEPRSHFVTKRRTGH